MEAIGVIIGILFVLIIVGFFVWLYVRILNRAGRSGWWCLTLLIPVVNIVMIWVFAFTRWPAIDDQPDFEEVFD